MLLLTAGCSYFATAEDMRAMESQVAELESTIQSLENTISESQNNAEEATPEPSATPQPTQEPEPTSTAYVFTEANVLEQLEVTEYTYSSIYSDYVFLVIKNNSEFNIKLYAEMIFRDENGELIGATNDEERAIEPGQEVLLDFNNTDEFASYEYGLSADPETYYQPLWSQLIKEVSLTRTKAVISVTNTSELTAEFVKYSVLFFSDGELVDYDWGYCTDEDSQIKSGNTNYDQAIADESFDTVLVYITGRAEVEETEDE